MIRNPLFLVVAILALLAGGAAAQSVDLEALNRIRAEALERSQVMELADHLTNRIGARLTGSPALREANAWARSKLSEWGLAQVRDEAFEFGEGWSFSSCSVRMVAPAELPLAALPEAWTPGTEGVVRGEAVRVELADDEDLEQQKGKLAGKVVFLDEARGDKPLERMDAADFERYDDARLAELTEIEIKEPGEGYRARLRKRIAMAEKRERFLAEEGVVATVELSSRNLGILRLSGKSWLRDPELPRGVPALVMAVEPYQRILRLLEEGETVELELEVAARYHGDDPMAYNTIAEIQGGDRRSELVIAGAHLDSWHAGTGATDDGAGSAVVLEAARILKAIGLVPRRTIRFALWGGEEQGLLGSRAYVESHVADRPETTDPEQLALPVWLRDETWPIRTKAEHGRISAYYNIDNGGGRIRGIYTQGNVAVVPIFQSWLAPLADLGATTVTNRPTGSTDHVPFDRVGVPGFQFVQDPLDYFPHTHHTNLDTFERLKREDLVQSSIVLAAFLWQTANRSELLPRKPMPQPPAKSAGQAGGERGAAGRAGTGGSSH